MAQRKPKKSPAPKRLKVDPSKDAPQYLVRIVTFRELKKPVKRTSTKRTHAKKTPNVYTTVTKRGSKEITSRYIYLKDFNKVNPTFDRYEKQFRKSKADDFGGSVQAFYGKTGKGRKAKYTGLLADGSMAYKSAKYQSITKKSSRHVSTGQRTAMEYELQDIMKKGFGESGRINRRKKSHGASTPRRQVIKGGKRGKRTSRGR